MQQLYISELDWNHEDLTPLKNLNNLGLFASDADGGYETTGPFTPLDSTEIDNVLIQIAAGAGQTVTNGTINIVTGGSGRTHASDSAVNALLDKGWLILIDYVAASHN